MSAADDQHRAKTPLWALAVVAAALLALAATGVLGVGRAGGLAASNFDMRYLYVAGEMWSAGESPYDGAAFTRIALERFELDAGAFAYPPQIAPLALLLAALPFQAAQVLMTLLNLAALGALAVVALRLAPRTGEASSRSSRAMSAVALAMLVGNPFASHVVWMGQTSLLAAAAAFGAWRAARGGRDALAGALLGLSTIKPQLVALLVLWFVLERRWRALAIGAATAAACALWPTLRAGFEATWAGWPAAVAQYQRNTVAATGFRHVFGLRSTLHQFGVDTVLFTVLAPISVVALYRGRQRLGGDDPAPLLFTLGALLLYAHDYDLAASVALVAPLAARTAQRLPLQLALLALLGVLFFPQRLWQRFDLGALARTRELALLALSAAHLVLALRARDAESPRADQR